MYGFKWKMQQRWLDFHRWIYWLPINRAIRAVQNEFYKWEDHVDPEVRHLDRMEQFWRTHCFCCKRWHRTDGKNALQPSEESMKVLGWIRVKFGSGSEMLLCPHGRYIYQQGVKDGKVSQEAGCN